MYGTMKDVYVAQERYADYRAEAEQRRNLHNIFQTAQSEVWAKMGGQMQDWLAMLRFGAGRADLLQNSPQ
ncbi:MAG: hypothetical protein R2911_14420 [Caldilineaceae bacterium]